MNKVTFLKILGFLILLQSILKAGYLKIAINYIFILEPISFGIALATIMMWLSLVASGIGLITKKRWAIIAMSIFTILSPVALISFTPFLTNLLPSGNVWFLVYVFTINMTFTILASFLLRKEANTPVT